MPATPSRRTVLRGALGAAAALVTTDRAGAATTRRPGGAPHWRPRTSGWVSDENARPGDRSWITGRAAPAGALEAFPGATSVNVGDALDVFVSSPGPTVSVRVFRLGFYQGLGARLVADLGNVATRAQAPAAPDALGTVDCDWSRTFTLDTSAYAPGQYLARLENPDGGFRWCPFIVRDDSSSAAYVYLSAVTTWQAYNAWGGYSLYRRSDPTGVARLGNERAVRVSFNRPYAANFANGAGDLMGNEFPLLFLAERLGLDLAYWTDLDLHERGGELARHRALLSLGHDEYYSPAMRDALTGAIAVGVNVAFFGANFCYRKVRFEPDRNGANRLMVNYRSTADPVTATDPAAATVNWADWPSDLPESTFSGSSYGGIAGAGPLRVVDAGGWFWRGTGLAEGGLLPGALADEFNNYNATRPHPDAVQLFGHSRVTGGVSDITYVAEPGGAGVFASGTGHWVNALSDAPRLGRHVPQPVADTTAPLQIATQNLLALFGQGPAGATVPSTGAAMRPRPT